MQLVHSKIKILHILGSLNTGGVESWLMHLLRQIDREVFQLDFCCLSGEEGVYAAEAKALGSQVFPIKLTKNLMLFNQQFAQLLHEQRYQIVHSHVQHFSGYIVRQAKRNGVPYCIAHSFTDPIKQSRSPIRILYLKLMRRWLKQYINMGLGNAKSSMRSLFGPAWHNQPQHKLMYCGVDLQRFRKTADINTVRAQWGIPADAPLIGHVGRLTPAKNHRFMLEIAEVIQQIKPETWFLFVGSGDLQAELEALIQKKQLKQIVFSGVSHDVAPFLETMDLFLFPSLWEGLPQSLIEAQAVGLRCLCADTITHEVAIVPDAVEFMSLDKTAAAWAEKSLAMLAVPKLEPQGAWQEVATSPFAIEKSVENLTQIYLKAATSNPEERRRQDNPLAAGAEGNAVHQKLKV